MLQRPSLDLAALADEVGTTPGFLSQAMSPLVARGWARVVRATRTKPRDTAEALYLLAAGALAHFAWLHAPAQAQGRVWNVSQGLLLAFALVLAARRHDWTVRIAGGLTYTDAEITASSNASLVGKTPRRQAKFIYQLSPSYSFGDVSAGLSVIGTTGSRDDGTAGPLTLMLLNRASGVDEPRLPAVR